jgi:Spy/CpxP family protein refolding chaperone
MKTKFGVLLLLAVSSLGWAQQDAPAPPPGLPGMGPGPHKQVMMYRRELGAWWKNSKIAEKLQLTDAQTKQLEDAFFQHRLKLVDYGADMEKADMKLQQMLDADTVNESAVNDQVDQVLAARGKMEREFTTMNLTFRRILSPEQWKQLRSIRGEQMHDNFFFRHVPPGAGPGGPGMGPSTAPGPQSELSEPEFTPESGECTTFEKNGMKTVQCNKRIEILIDDQQEL